MGSGIDIPRWKWRSREALIQEIDARGRIKDIQLHYDLQEAIEVKWWEPLLKMLVLVAGIGFAVTFLHFLHRAVDLYGALAADSETPGPSPVTLKVILWMIAGSFALMLVGGLLSLEMLMVRLAAMRRLLQIQGRVLENVQAELDVLRTGISPDPLASEGTGAPSDQPR
jgi:hypothetical protein